MTIRVRGPRVRGMWGGDPGSLTPRVSNFGVAIRVRGPRDRPHGAKVSGPHPEFFVFFIIFLCLFFVCLCFVDFSLVQQIVCSFFRFCPEFGPGSVMIAFSAKNHVG